MVQIESEVPLTPSQVRPAEAPGKHRYVLQVDLPDEVDHGVRARVDEVLTRAARELDAALPDVHPTLERLATVAGETSGNAALGVHARHGVPVLEVDIAARRVFVGERLVPLPFKEFEILRVLLGRPGEVVAREEIAAALGEAGEKPAPRTIDVHVHRIRTKLEATADCISTVRGLGYRFNPSAAVVVA